MLEANRNRKCSDLNQFVSEEDAWNQFGRMGLSNKTKSEHKVVQCPKCNKWHILHDTYTLDEGGGE